MQLFNNTLTIYTKYKYFFTRNVNAIDNVTFALETRQLE